jgi:hypothetical protein
MAYKGRVTLGTIFSTLSQQMEEAKSAQNDKRLEELEKVVSVLNDIAAQFGDTLTWEGGMLLPSQGHMTIADFLCSLCERIMSLKNVPNAMHASKLYETVYFLNNVAAQCKDNLLYCFWLDDMVYSLNHVDVPFKMGVPTAAEIRATLAAADQYQGVHATLIRRQQLRHPKALKVYLWDDDYETVLEPEWVGIARASGPYMETIDCLLYKFDGTLLSSGGRPLVVYQFSDGARKTLDANRVLEEALLWAEKDYGANPQDWEVCQIEITDEEGCLPWLPAEKEQ